jgi:hypothetical protein
MLIRSLHLRLLFAVLFGALVGFASASTGASPAWAVPLGVVATLVSFAAQTYYAKRFDVSQRHTGADRPQKER